ncbi:hypothetical protein Tco_0946490 [Tanacetum coccineum]
MPTDPHPHTSITQHHHSTPNGKNKSRRPKRKDTEIPHSSVPSDLVNVADEAVNEEPTDYFRCANSREAAMILSFDTCVLNDEEVFAEKDIAEKEVSTVDLVTTAGKVVTTANVEVSTASPTTATITNVELTLAQTLQS